MRKRLAKLLQAHEDSTHTYHIPCSLLHLLTLISTHYPFSIRTVINGWAAWGVTSQGGRFGGCFVSDRNVDSEPDLFANLEDGIFMIDEDLLTPP